MERIERTLIGEADVRRRTEELGAEIARDFAGQDTVHMVGVLKGAFVFMADLGRAVWKAGGPDVRYDFIRASAYGVAVKGGGERARAVRLDMVPTGLDGKDVLLIEDILDQGFTLAHIRDYLGKECGARSVKLCVLLDKDLSCPSAQVQAVRRRLVPDYTGFRIPDRWVAGCGLDVAEEFRALPEVVVVREEFYRHGQD
jgi:hypoxanthine phosphoribosyltransferase